MSDNTLTGGGSLSDGGSSLGSESGPSAAESQSPPTLDSIFEDAERSVAEAEAAATPEQPGVQTSQVAPPTVAPPAPTEAVPAPVSPGEPPKERWPDILENTRTKVRDETLQQVVQQYGGDLRAAEQMRADPVAFVTQFTEELLNDPRYAQSMTSQAARVLSRTGRKAAPVTDENGPGPDIDAGNGMLLYSAQRGAEREAWIRDQMRQEFQQSLGPLQQEYQTRKQQEQHQAKVQQFREQSERLMSADISEWQQMPYFKENLPEIRSLQAQIYEEGKDASGRATVSPTLALRRAYGRVMQSAVPKAQQQTEQQLRGSAAQKLRAATANPSGTAHAAARRPRNWEEAFEQAQAELG